MSYARNFYNRQGSSGLSSSMSQKSGGDRYNSSSETGSVLVDWVNNDDEEEDSLTIPDSLNILDGEADSLPTASIQSFPVRGSKRIGKYSRNAMSQYDSDSSDELRGVATRSGGGTQQLRRGSVGTGSRQQQQQQNKQRPHASRRLSLTDLGKRSSGNSANLFSSVAMFMESFQNSVHDEDEFNADNDVAYPTTPGTAYDDDDELDASEHCMILTDDEDEAEIDDEVEDDYHLSKDNIEKQQEVYSRSHSAISRQQQQKQLQSSPNPQEDNNSIPSPYNVQGVLDTGHSRLTSSPSRERRGDATQSKTTTNRRNLYNDDSNDARLSGMMADEHPWRNKSSSGEFEIQMDDPCFRQKKEEANAQRVRKLSRDLDVDFTPMPRRRSTDNIIELSKDTDEDIIYANDQDNFRSPSAAAHHNPNSKGGESEGEEEYVTTSDDNSSAANSSMQSSLSGLDDVDDDENIIIEEDDDNNDVDEDTAAISELQNNTNQRQRSSIKRNENERDGYPVTFLEPTAVPPFQHASAAPPLAYLDPVLVESGISKRDAGRFATEHRILLRALLQILFERDQVGVEDDVENPDNVLKKGPLKKYAHGGIGVVGQNWKVKYVEIRRGNFSYFEDNHTKTATSGRKIISLRTGSTICIPRNDQSPAGRVLELSQEGGPKRLWMANSEEERQAWIRVIRDAMVGGGNASGTGGAGGSGTAAENTNNNSLVDSANLILHRDAIERYKMAQIGVQEAWNRKQYTACLSFLWGRSLRVPAAWVRDEAGVDLLSNHSSNRGLRKNNDINKLVRYRVNGFLKKLSADTVSINDSWVRGDSPHGPERIVGAFTRCILEYDRLANGQATMSELQAITHARNILLAVHESRNRDDAHAAIDHMCGNRNLVICLPSNSEKRNPLRLHVFSAGEDEDDAGNKGEEMSGWVTTRSRSHKTWKNRYCVVSEGVLSYYEHGTPRPHGLRGQLVLVGANLSQISGAGASKNLLILRIVTSDQERERQICFKNQQDFDLWKEAIQTAIDSCTARSASGKKQKKKKASSGSKIIKGASEGGGKIIKGAADLIMFRGMRGVPDSVEVEGSTRSEATNKNDPTVHVVVESSSVYKIITSDPCGNNEKDTLATVRANFLQSYLLSGGDQGKMSQGNELLELEFLQGLAKDEAFDIMFPATDKDYEY